MQLLDQIRSAGGQDREAAEAAVLAAIESQGATTSGGPTRAKLEMPLRGDMPMPRVTDISVMSNPAEDINVVLLPNGELCTMLEQAELEERTLSDRRKDIHALIDYRSLTAPEGDFELATLWRKERELSAKRLHLHQRILDLRLERSRRLDGMRTPLRAVESSDR
jgi:hypothetical protein